MQDEIVSKTKRKREMHELQALGVALVALPESQLDDLALDGNLHKAVLRRNASPPTRGGAGSAVRGKLMRNVDPAPIRARLEAITGSSAQANARHKRLERCASDAGG
jgi:ribosome-associated protein